MGKLYLYILHTELELTIKNWKRNEKTHDSLRHFNSILSFCYFWSSSSFCCSSSCCSSSCCTSCGCSSTSNSDATASKKLFLSKSEITLSDVLLNVHKFIISSVDKLFSSSFFCFKLEYRSQSQFHSPQFLLVEQYQH